MDEGNVDSLLRHHNCSCIETLFGANVDELQHNTITIMYDVISQDKHKSEF